MNCFFHETQPATRRCVNCRKHICEECFHMEYPDYCWTCGLDHDNSLGEREKSFDLPRVLQGKATQYAIRKLAAAGGAWIGVTILGSLIIGLIANSGLIFVLFSYLSIGVVYTYGLACSVLTDLASRFVIRIGNKARAVVYALLGIAFPWVMVMIDSRPGLLNHPVNMLIGGCAALLFWYIEQWKNRKEIQFVIAIFASSVPIIYLILAMKGIHRL